MTQRDRVREPYPWTWEPFAITIAVLAVMLTTGVQVGRAVANQLAGGVWQWPPIDGWAGSTIAVLAGNAQAGLEPRTNPSAGPVLLGWCVGVVTVVCLVAVGWAAMLVYRRCGPGRIRGVATPTEVSRSLGVRRLRRTQAQVRPDLYTGRGRRR